MLIVDGEQGALLGGRNPYEFSATGTRVRSSVVTI
jgi:hypothetical protein